MKGINQTMASGNREARPLTWSPITALSTFVDTTLPQLTALLNRFGSGRRATPSPPGDGTIADVATVWDVDLDITTTSLDDGTKFSLKGRCKRCWDNLLARLDDNLGWTRIKCRVCGNTIEGEIADEKYNQMLNRTGVNIMNMHWFGRTPEYGNVDFVQKIFPEQDTLSKSELAARAKSTLLQQKKRNCLTRHEFPHGSPGFLFMQANMLMAGLVSVTYPDEISVVDFPNVRFMDDGSLAISRSLEGFRTDPNYSSNKLMNRTGTTIIEAMTAAFACEFAMKAICLTCKDKAPKTHDLMALHDDLPPISRTRLAADYPKIVETLRSARHTFGAWRYFEMNSGESAIRTMIDVPRAHALGKAARVILDETLMVGLSASVRVEVEDNVSVVDDIENHHLHSKVQITAGEAPPRSSK